MLGGYGNNMDGVKGWSSTGENFILKHDLSLSQRDKGRQNHILRRRGLIRTLIFEVWRGRPGDSGIGLCEVTSPSFLDDHCSWWWVWGAWGKTEIPKANPFPVENAGERLNQPEFRATAPGISACSSWKNILGKFRASRNQSPVEFQDSVITDSIYPITGETVT